MESSTTSPPPTEQLPEESTNADFNAAALPRSASLPTATTQLSNANDGSVPADVLRDLTDGNTLSDSEDGGEGASPRNVTLTVHDELKKIRERAVGGNEEFNKESEAQGKDDAAEGAIKEQEEISAQKQQEAGAAQQGQEARKATFIGELPPYDELGDGDRSSVQGRSGVGASSNVQDQTRTASAKLRINGSEASTTPRNTIDERYTIAPLNVVHGSTGATNKTLGSVDLNSSTKEGHDTTPRKTGWGDGWNSTGESSNASMAAINECHTASPRTPVRDSINAAKSTLESSTTSEPIADDRLTPAPSKTSTAATNSTGESSNDSKTNTIERYNTPPRKDGWGWIITDATNTTGEMSSASPTNTVEPSDTTFKNKSDGDLTIAPLKTGLDSVTATTVTGESRNASKEKTGIRSNTSAEKDITGFTTKTAKADPTQAKKPIESSTSTSHVKEGIPLTANPGICGRFSPNGDETALAKKTKDVGSTSANSNVPSQTDPASIAFGGRTGTRGEVSPEKHNIALAKNSPKATTTSAHSSSSISQTEQGGTVMKEKAGKSALDTDNPGMAENALKSTLISANKPMGGINASRSQIEGSSIMSKKQTGKIPFDTNNTGLAEHIRQSIFTPARKPMGGSSTSRSQTEQNSTASKEQTSRMSLHHSDGGLAEKVRSRTLTSAKQDMKPVANQTDRANAASKDKTGDKDDNTSPKKSGKEGFISGVNTPANSNVVYSIAWTKKTADTAYAGVTSHSGRTWVYWLLGIVLLFIAAWSSCIGAYYHTLNGRLDGLEGTIVCQCFEQLPPYRKRTMTGTRDSHNVSDSTLRIPDPVFLNSPEAALTSLRYILTLMPTTYISGRLGLELLTKLETAETALAYANENAHSTNTTTVYTTITIRTTSTPTLTTSASPSCDSTIYSLPLDLAILISPLSCTIDAEICAVRELFISREASEKELEVQSKDTGEEKEKESMSSPQYLDQWVIEWNSIVVRCLKGLVKRSLEAIVELE